MNAPIYYVYMLFDTETCQPIYIGKGSGYRIDDHEGQQDNNIKKADAIKELKQAGRLGKKIIGRYATEDEAFAVEATLIKWVHGIDALANQVHGKNHELIRSRGNYEDIPGIDVERLLNNADGRYTEKQVQSIEENRIVPKLAFLAEIAERLLFALGRHDVLVSEVDISRPQDPQIRLSSEEWPCNLRLKIQLTGSDIAPAFTSRSGGNLDRQALDRFAKRLNEDVRNGTPPFMGLWQVEKNPSKGTNESRPSLDDEKGISDCIRRMIALLDLSTD